MQAFTTFLPLEAITEDHFHKSFNINVLGPLLTMQAAVKHLASDDSGWISGDVIVVSGGL